MVLTATRGEGGEVIPAELKHLEGDRAGLAEVREQEIAEAIVPSGCACTPSSADPHASSRTRGWNGAPTGRPSPPRCPRMPCACAADVTTVARHIAAVIDAFCPHAVITYAANGGYGHPDHVRVHEATTAAIDLAEWRVGRLLFVDTPTEVARRIFDPRLQSFAATGFAAADSIPAKPPVGQIVIGQDVSSVLPAKRAALQAHRTQVSVSDRFCFALSNGVGQAIGDARRLLHRCRS